MQIHELNPFQGTLGSEAFLVVDNGDDTGKISVERLTQPINDRIDDIITSPAPTEQEIIDARRGWNEVVYGSLGTAIRSQVKQILAQFYKFNTYDLLAVYGTPISRTRNGVTFTWDDAGQVCEVSGEAVGGDAYASIYTQTGAWPGIFEHGVVYTIGYETTDPNVKLRIAVWEGVETTPDYYYFDEDGHFGIPPEAAKISIDLWVASGDTVSAVVKNVYMLRTYTAKEVAATIRDAMIGADRHMYNSLGDAIREQMNGKVDKEEDMGLSQNSFTDAEKAKLEDIETGAQVNVIETVKVDGVALTPDENKAVDIPVDDTLTEAGTPAEAKAVGDELEKKANVDGYYETLTSGQTEQIIATEAITDTEPYIYRKAGGANDVGDRVYDTIVGGSIVWNQLNNTQTNTETVNGITWTKVQNNIWTASGTATADSTFRVGYWMTKAGHIYFVKGCPPGGSTSTYYVGNDTGGGRIYKREGNDTGIALTATIKSGVTVSNLKFSQIVVDLTVALGSTIADYVYSLETTTAGAGVAWVRRYFTKEYFAYCEPHFEHVQVSAKKTVGFNQWDISTDNVGKQISTDGTLTDGANWSTSDFIRVLPNTEYYFYNVAPSANVATMAFYDSEKNFISLTAISGSSGQNVSGVKTTPDGTMYLRVTRKKTVTDSGVNLHGDRDGEYEPYRKRTYPLDSSLTLRGYPMLDASNKLCYDGDIYRHDGSGEYRYSEVDLGTLNYTYDATQRRFYASLDGVKKTTRQTKLRCPIYTEKCNGETYSQDWDKVIYAGGSSTIYIHDHTYTDAATLKTALSGVYLVYELNTPEPFTAEPFQYPMVVDPLGTEEFVDYGVEQGDRDVAIPVGHTSKYPQDLRGKLQHLPGLSSSGDGRYVVVQTGNQMTLSPDTSLGLIAALEARVAALEGGNG